MTTEKQGCTTQRHEITEQDLPLCCPMADQRVWDGHPRVYLPITKTGEVTCPYCETHYTLTGHKK